MFSLLPLFGSSLKICHIRAFLLLILIVVHIRRITSSFIESRGRHHRCFIGVTVSSSSFCVQQLQTTTPKLLVKLQHYYNYHYPTFGVHRRYLKMSQKENEESISHLVVSVRDHLQIVDCDDTNNNNKIRLILASQSPRRREILTMMGLENRFVVIPSPLDESALASQLQHLDPIEYTRTLALEKAMALARSTIQSDSDDNNNTNNKNTLILGSDTIVAYADHILEKPVDTNDAKRMLHQLQGQHHQVHTGVVLIRINSSNNNKNENNIQIITSFTDTADVIFAKLTTADINAYVATGEPMDKAGSYGIQGIGGQLVTSIEGDFFTVMGLPMHRTSRALADAIQDIIKEESA